ncbi:MAG: LPXTG cell wall anchor domain-containing protein, partial [Clostridia bacterium]|nr:LPXTG cell wall anchor domain-containing protein [Clostridia bacterium]
AKSIFSVPGNGYRASINVPVTAGSHTVEIIGLADGEEKVFYTFTYSGIPEPETQPGTEPGTEPETQPATGDAAVAMFAVIAVLAMGAAVVFIKKRAF